MEYFISIDGKQLGPFPVEALRANGLTPETLVWTQGMANWVPASQVAELQPLFVSQAQATQPHTQTQAQPQPQPQQPQQPGYQQPYQQPAGQPYYNNGAQQGFAPNADVLMKPMSQVTGALDDGGMYRKWMPTAYMILGVVFCVIPILYLINVVDAGYFKRGLTAVAAILNILIALGAGIFGLFYWLNRRNNVKQLTDSNAPTLSIVGHFLQSAGECGGLLYYCSYAAITLITGLFTGLDSSIKAGTIILNGVGNAVNYLVVGLVVLCLGRLFGEIAKKKAEAE